MSDLGFWLTAQMQGDNTKGMLAIGAVSAAITMFLYVRWLREEKAASRIKTPPD